ncbi:MAG TPA: FAD-dependent oxidoreductase [Bryobacteraceae bacterium]|jgi:NADPH-dependent 2,4-dienoyl-CoA reductase/sulfur reductase-like enzyme|nr:FAD-dependent oxidoreductase [Bryobacteraceae bacterium]
MKTFPYVIAGGGMVAGYAAKEMVERGLKAGELCILSADRALPYERPPLSKGFLAGKETEDSIRINPPEFYESHGIDVRLRTRISGLDAGRRTLRIESGNELAFEKLILATGSEIRTLEIPGSDLAGICYLRSVDDSERIRREAANAKQAAVIGGGFIGMETASVLAQQGVDVTMILREDRIWKQFFTPAMSEFFEGYYGARGVRFVKEGKLSKVQGRGEVSGVALESGKTIPCTLVVAGIGVRPATDVFRHSGIDVGDGVTVDEYLETSHPDIYAAGDLAHYPDVLFGKRRRVEHWDNAVSQGQHCGRALMGDRAAFRHVPYFFSDVFDLSYEFWGDTAEADEIVERGDLSTTSFSVWWLSNKRLVAAFTMNRPDEERENAPKWIEAGQKIDAQRLRGAGPLAEAAV